MTPTTLLLKIWPELQNHIDNIHIIDSHLHTAFPTTSNEIIVKDILQAKKEGKTKFLFYLIGEGIVLQMLQKIQNIASLLKNNINSKDLIYVCGASDGAEIYEKLYKQYNWGNKISVICVNAHWFSLNYSILSSLPVEYNIKEKSIRMFKFFMSDLDNRFNYTDSDIYDLVKYIVIKFFKFYLKLNGNFIPKKFSRFFRAISITTSITSAAKSMYAHIIAFITCIFFICNSYYENYRHHQSR
jgi:hypothetical protein